MPSVTSNGLTIEYETGGSGPPLLLIMGLGGQLTDWPRAFVDLLEADFTVIRFDNRDVGLSSKIDAPAPVRRDFVRAVLRPSRAGSAYDLVDMAADTAGLLDALDIDAAHVVGMSMGGMIAQQLTLDFSSRVRSLCSIMSHTGNRISGRPKPRVLAALARRADPHPEEVLDVAMSFFAMIGGRDWDPVEQRSRTEASLRRSFSAEGVLRQSMAIAVSPERTDLLASVRAPTLVVHGLDDTLVQPIGGIATAEAIGHARLLLLPRMGHDLPSTRHREIAGAIRANASAHTFDCG